MARAIESAGVDLFDAEAASACMREVCAEAQLKLRQALGGEQTPTRLSSVPAGEAATRGSDGSISLATAIFIGPPATREKARTRT